MQNIDSIALETAAKNTGLTLQSGDQIVIMVTAKDMDVVRPFNQNYSSAETVQNVAAGGNTPNSGIVTVNGPIYIVDSAGNIDFPVIGKISASGQSLDEFKGQLRSRISQYVINPTVNARIVNFKITVLGEVTRPGEYTVSDGRATILSALGMAGDLTMYGKRDDILVIRSVDGAVQKERINLKDANFINSPFFNLKQGDVIAVSANNNREVTAKTNPNTGLYISAASVAIGAIAILVSLLKK